MLSSLLLSSFRYVVFTNQASAGTTRYISAIYRGCLPVKNSFINISEVNRQCLHSLDTRSEANFEKVSSTMNGHLEEQDKVWNEDEDTGDECK